MTLSAISRCCFWSSASDTLARGMYCYWMGISSGCSPSVREEFIRHRQRHAERHMQVWPPGTTDFRADSSSSPPPSPLQPPPELLCSNDSNMCSSWTQCGNWLPLPRLCPSQGPHAWSRVLEVQVHYNALHRGSLHVITCHYMQETACNYTPLHEWNGE